MDGTQKACGACHGAPPASARHPQPPAGSDCHACHPDTVRADGTLDVAGGHHIDGRVDVGALACTGCHGDPARALAPAAPPRGSRGETATTSRAVGAHQRHLAGGTVAGPTPCDGCHVVPADLSHVDGAATVTFGAGARRGGAAPAWRPADPAGPSCSGTYCHGATLGAGGTATAPVWTRVDGSQLACGSCHGAPPTKAGHPQGALAARCSACHPDTVRPDGTIDLAGGHHIDGRIDVAAGGGCAACHGAPPASGAHLVHARLPAGVEAGYGALTVLEDVAPAGGPDYAFGCGHCHPLDPARHMDGVVDVTLAPAGAAAGSLKARNAPGAAYDAAGGSCGGVYCHSSGQAAPAYVASPAWTAPAGALGCGGCHANPPAYPSGGAGAPDANGHLQLQADGFEWGHFAGLPGPWHQNQARRVLARERRRPHHLPDLPLRHRRSRRRRAVRLLLARHHRHVPARRGPARLRLPEVPRHHERPARRLGSRAAAPPRERPARGGVRPAHLAAGSRPGSRPRRTAPRGHTG